MSKRALLPLRRILCPTDFSEVSLEALEVAVELASHFSGEIRLVHVVPDIPRPNRALALGPEPENCGLDISEYEEMLHTAAQQKLRELIDQRIPRTISAGAIVSNGEAATQILRTAIDESADLIVIATQGQTGLSHPTFGSVTEKVVHLAACPVLTIRGSAAPRGSLPSISVIDS